MELVERVKDLPRWAKWLLMTGVAVGIIGADYLLYFSPKYEQVRIMTNNAKNLESQVRIINAAGKDYQKLVKRIEEMKKTLAELESSFPTETGSLLSFLSTIASPLVSIEKIEEGKVIDKPYYKEKLYKVVAKGSYLNEVKWLENTLKKSRALSIRSLDFKKGENGTVEADVVFSYVSVKKGGR